MNSQYAYIQLITKLIRIKIIEILLIFYCKTIAFTIAKKYDLESLCEDNVLVMKKTT